VPTTLVGNGSPVVSGRDFGRGKKTITNGGGGGADGPYYAFAGTEVKAKGLNRLRAVRTRPSKSLQHGGDHPSLTRCFGRRERRPAVEGALDATASEGRIKEEGPNDLGRTGKVSRVKDVAVKKMGTSRGGAQG